jgi:hypothetical protein
MMEWYLIVLFTIIILVGLEVNLKAISKTIKWVKDLLLYKVVEP